MPVIDLKNYAILMQDWNSVSIKSWKKWSIEWRNQIGNLFRRL